MEDERETDPGEDKWSNNICYYLLDTCDVSNLVLGFNTNLVFSFIKISIIGVIIIFDHILLMRKPRHRNGTHLKFHRK